MTDPALHSGSSRGDFPPYSPDPVMFDNGLMAEPASAARAPVHRFVALNDEALTQVALRALGEELGARRDVSLRVADGRVTLDGCVDSYYERACAERALRFVDGVRGIDNRITVKPILSASNIKLHIIEQLRAEVLDEANRIEVHVQDGHVVISGTVHSSVERRTVEESVRSAPGVESVDNQLRVGG